MGYSNTDGIYCIVYWFETFQPWLVLKTLLPDYCCTHYEPEYASTQFMNFQKKATGNSLLGKGKIHFGNWH